MMYKLQKSLQIRFQPQYLRAKPHQAQRITVKQELQWSEKQEPLKMR